MPPFSTPALKAIDPSAKSLDRPAVGQVRDDVRRRSARRQWTPAADELGVDVLQPHRLTAISEDFGNVTLDPRRGRQLDVRARCLKWGAAIDRGEQFVEQTESLLRLREPVGGHFSLSHAVAALNLGPRDPLLNGLLVDHKTHVTTSLLDCQSKTANRMSSPAERRKGSRRRP